MIIMRHIFTYLLQTEFEKMGGAISDGDQVKKIVPGRTIILSTSKGNYCTKTLIITAGPWCKDILEPIGLYLPIKVYM